MKIAKIESIPLRIPFTTGGPSDAGAWGKAGLQTVDSLIVGEPHQVRPVSIHNVDLRVAITRGDERHPATIR